MSESTPDTRTSRVGTVVTHRRYVPYSHAHYAGNLVDGAYSLGLFGDVGTRNFTRSSSGESGSDSRTKRSLSPCPKTVPTSIHPRIKMGKRREVFIAVQDD